MSDVLCLMSDVGFSMSNVWSLMSNVRHPMSHVWFSISDCRCLKFNAWLRSLLPSCIVELRLIFQSFQYQWKGKWSIPQWPRPNNNWRELAAQCSKSVKATARIWFIWKKLKFPSCKSRSYLGTRWYGALLEHSPADETGGVKMSTS